MKRDWINILVLWVLLTAVGEYWAFTANFFPTAAAEEALFIDDAFRTLTKLAVPVASTVLAFLLYSAIRFRVADDHTRDGSPLKTSRPLTWGWFIATTGLAIFVVFNPGLKGIRELAANPNADMVIQLEGVQWHWNVNYPDFDLNYERALQIAVPVDTRVKFEITSADVIHSVWIPAFRLKMDAVPGRTTEMYLTPTEIGDYETDPLYRVQCAELCGTGHARMKLDVRVLDEHEFEAWLAEARTFTEGNNMDMEGMDMDGMDSNMDPDMDMNEEMDPDMDMDTNEEMNMNDGTEMEEEEMEMESGG